jgi:hypothetical protein
LRLHEDDLVIRPRREGLTFVGYRTWATHRRLPQENVRRLLRRVRWMKKAYAAGTMPRPLAQQRLVSWLGHARNVQSYRWLQRLEREWVFTPG